MPPCRLTARSGPDRLDNALALFDDFVRATIKHPDSATLRGLERPLRRRLLIQPSYWSQIKGRSRQIGERLARQFEQLCHKPRGWMDCHATVTVPPHRNAAPDDPSEDTGPADDDERFIVGLVLTYYRRHPQRARARLLDLLGEALQPPAPAAAAPAPSGAAGDDSHSDRRRPRLWRRETKALSGWAAPKMALAKSVNTRLSSGQASGLPLGDTPRLNPKSKTSMAMLMSCSIAFSTCLVAGRAAASIDVLGAIGAPPG